MASMTTQQDPSSRWLFLGILGGLLGGIVMAIFAMIAAATYQGTGFFTPMYHIASSVGWTSAAEAMKSSIEAAGTGDSFFLTTGPALGGFVIHLGVAAAWGLVFVALVQRVRRTQALPIAGAAFGLLVMLFMAFVALPLISRIFDSGEPIEKMAQMVGWTTFSAEHAIFGLVTGLTLAVGSTALSRKRVRALERAPRAA